MFYKDLVKQTLYSVYGFVEIGGTAHKITCAAELIALSAEVQAMAYPRRNEDYSAQLLLDEIESVIA